ncbi:DJ-1/PfpI family protein [Pseudomassariella vexata]|uniref:D-lactate dehydratase n=1 Tax=Pseudomassariella vexata TaxID=1141098 RepID=A0A1Y2EAK9_9PEZI|nr:DJ-1/PfpI family protein [Pseudomassariella vexata]ORY68286.1 DJ-1/PfpI family protein [Pseudomassariella vexata]
MAPKVLVVLTSCGQMTTADKLTGWYLPELAHPYDVLSPKTEIVMASPKGGIAPVDMGSVEAFKSDPSSSSFFANQKSVWETTKPISSFLGRASEFAALFYPGGHGPMFDLATDTDSIQLINEFVAAEKPVAAVCHGPAVFTNVVLPSGKHLLADKEVTGFSNAEEDMAQMTEFMPFLLETKIKDVGGKYVKADEAWGEKVVVVDGGKLITGQNPASAKGTGEAILKAIGL